jgi:hypothetical protein
VAAKMVTQTKGDWSCAGVFVSLPLIHWLAIAFDGLGTAITETTWSAGTLILLCWAQLKAHNG